MNDYKNYILYFIFNEGLTPIGFGKPDTYIRVEDFYSLYNKDMRLYLKSKYGNLVGVLVPNYKISFNCSSQTSKGIIGVL